MNEGIGRCYSPSIVSEEPEKKDVARALLLSGTVYVHLDPRIEGVAVPRQFRNDHQLVLQVGLDMPVPIPDLRVDDVGIRATLSFSRTPFACEVPWESVFALVGEDGKGHIWPESLPAEIRGEIAREARRRRAEQEGDGPTDGPTPDDLDETPDNLRRLPRRPRAAPALSQRRDAAEPMPERALDRSSRDADGGPDEPEPGPSAPGGKRKSLPPYLRLVK